ncbi:MAG: hypothetical protein ACRD9S_14795 [Pyrinomonadaceae bacterium]
MRHIHSYLPKPCSLQTRSLCSLAFMMVVLSSMSSTVFGQGPMVKPKPAPLKFASEGTPIPEDVFFNAQAREVSTPTSLTANQISATSIGSVLSLLFDSARVSLQSQRDPLVASWAGSITVPTNMSAKPKAKTYLQHVRGSLTKDADTRVSIFLQLGVRSFLAEFPYGMKHTGDIKRKFVSAIKSGSSASYTAFIVIYAERRSPKNALLVDIDALDVEVR